MVKVTPERIDEIIKIWEDTRDDVGRTTENIGQFYCKEGNIWVGCDNQDGHCWVEDFGEEIERKLWLAGLADTEGKIECDAVASLIESFEQYICDNEGMSVEGDAKETITRLMGFIWTE